VAPDNGPAVAIDVDKLPPIIAELIVEGTAYRSKVRSRGPKFMSVVRYLRQQGYNFASVLALLEEHPNGVQSKYLDEGRLDKELERVWDKIEDAVTDLPKILVAGGSRAKNADEAIRVLHAAKVPFYRRDTDLVRVAVINAKSADGKIVKVPTIAPVEPPRLGRALGQRIYWHKIVDFGWEQRIDPPEAVAKQILQMFDEWPFPPLLGVIGTPTLRPDGTLLTKPVSGDHKLLRESSSQGHVRWQIKRMSKQGEQQHDFSAF
jgi:hypothetical protein